MQFLTIASTAMSVIGALQAGSQQSAQYEAAARANEYNAAVARQRAETTTAVYGQREEQQRRAAAIQGGQRRAAAAQSGFGLGGSASDIERQSQIMAELDALNIRYEGGLEAKGLLDQSTLETYQASTNRAASAGAKTSGYLGAAGKMLSGAGDYLRVTAPKTPANTPLKLG